MPRLLKKKQNPKLCYGTYIVLFLNETLIRLDCKVQKLKQVVFWEKYVSTADGRLKQ